MSTRDGGPAFPETGSRGRAASGEGMSLRDFFASNSDTFTIYDGERLVADEHNANLGPGDTYMPAGDVSRADALTALARLRYEEADAMLKERER